MSPGKVFYAVLDMGLGHATRSLPIIREFINRKWKIRIGSSGRSLAFLKRELPDLQFIETPGYRLSYSHGRFLLPKLLFQIPKLFYRVKKEWRVCSRVVEEFSPDIIMSDHCYGMYHDKIPCYFLSHQIYFAVPPFVQMFSPFVSRFNFAYHRQYQKVLIPDEPDNGRGLLSGELSRLPHSNHRYSRIGILSSISKRKVQEQLDLLVSISGPEPQRSIFEKIVLEQIQELPGKKIVVLGKSEENKLLLDQENLKVYTHLPRHDMEMLFNKATLIVTRPGYSTLMELVELGQKALLVPTPGQTEQEYLAAYMLERKWFYSVRQDHINLSKDIDIAKNFNGLAKPGATQQSVSYLFNNVLEI
jgi:UDP-N-acetylglucosamine:LPS N-acetylglucosamine transferase